MTSHEESAALISALANRWTRLCPTCAAEASGIPTDRAEAALAHIRQFVQLRETHGPCTRCRQPGRVFSLLP